MYLLLYGCTELKVSVVSAFEMLFVIFFQIPSNKSQLILKNVFYFAFFHLFGFYQSIFTMIKPN